MSKNKSSIFIPVIIAISIVAGIGIGTFYSNQFSGSNFKIINTSSNKINSLLRIIDNQYVDSVDMNDLVEKAMPQILNELDPHSVYIPAKDLEAVNSELEGSFSGIGIHFSIQNDTIHVNNVIQGGPSEKVGLIAGDRIISVDDTAFVGKEVTIESAPKKLKGPKGSKVKIGVVRPTEKEVLHFTIIRGDIPIHSIDASYLIKDKLGYIKINKFGRTAHTELLVAIAKLKQQQCNGLIIDLRGNSGGLMEVAIQIANEFLPKGKLIVYAEGRNFAREERFANGTGTWQHIPLVVLTDEGSASASEILAGAIQDNDRGIIIGRRTFGKGLVQQPIEFRDGSAIRLTITRYYTPSGRSIQKYYEIGQGGDYDMDIVNRYEHGEFFSQDSIKLDENLKYYTSLGRTVYGGGGVMPDIFVPQDTTGFTSYYSSVVNKGITIQYAFQYTDKNRSKLIKYKDATSLQNYLKTQGIVENFIQFADSKQIKRRNILIQKSYKLLEKNLYGNIIYNMLGLEEYIKFINQTDPTVNKAIEVLEKEESQPVAPHPTSETENHPS